jgi:hypothetical protein
MHGKYAILTNMEHLDNFIILDFHSHLADIKLFTPIILKV